MPSSPMQRRESKVREAQGTVHVIHKSSRETRGVPGNT